MKIPISATFLVLAVSSFVFATDPTAPQSQPSTSHSFSMDAKSVATGGIVAIDNNYATVDGVDRDSSTHTAFTSTNKTTSNHGVTIEISGRNFSNELPGSAVIEWLFFAKAAARGAGEEYIYSSDTRVLQFTPGGSNSFRVKSPVIRSRVETTVSGANPSGSNPGNVYYVPKVSTETSGDKLTGWAVRMLVDGKIVSVKGSTRHYEDIARNNELIAGMKQQ